MKKTLAVLALSTLALIPLHAYAGDTYEAYDEGSVNLEPSFTLDSISNSKPNLSTAMNVQYGVLDSLTIYGGMSFSSEDGLAGGDLAASIGGLWNAVTTDHLAFDLLLDFSYAMSEGYSLSPGFEFNFDLEPEQALWGLYVRAYLSLYGQYDTEELLNKGLANKADAAKADFGLDLTLGTYFTICETNQIFVEGGFVYENLASALGDAALVDPFISLGFNTVITDNFELVSELKFMLPPPDDEEYEFSGAITIGGIFIIPQS